MGQYRQWLHYRDIDQLLRSQLAVSEHELEQLQTQVEVLGKHVFSLENDIFQALIERKPDDMQNHPEEPVVHSDEPVVEVGEGREDEVVIEEVEDEDLATISPALLAWGRLPNFNTQMIQEPEGNSPTQISDSPPSQPDEQLLPADINEFINAHDLINSQTNIPWWLQDIASPSEEAQEPHPIDRQSERADHLVQRWFERWGQAPPQTKQSREDRTP